MKPRDVKLLLWEIGKTNPRFLGLLQKPVDDSGLTVGTHWATLLSKLDPGFLRDVLGDMAEGKTPIPDDFVLEVRREVGDLTRKEIEQTEAHERHVRYLRIRKQKRERAERARVLPLFDLIPDDMKPHTETPKDEQARKRSV